MGVSEPSGVLGRVESVIHEETRCTRRGAGSSWLGASASVVEAHSNWAGSSFQKQKTAKKCKNDGRSTIRTCAGIHQGMVLSETPVISEAVEDFRRIMYSSQQHEKRATPSSRHLRRRRRHARDAIVTRVILLGGECARDGVAGTVATGLQLEKPCRAGCRRQRCPVETDAELLRRLAHRGVPSCAAVRQPLAARPLLAYERRQCIHVHCLVQRRVTKVSRSRRRRRCRFSPGTPLFFY